MQPARPYCFWCPFSFVCSREPVFQHVGSPMRRADNFFPYPVRFAQDPPPGARAWLSCAERDSLLFPNFLSGHRLSTRVPLRGRISASPATTLRGAFPMAAAPKRGAKSRGSKAGGKATAGMAPVDRRAYRLQLIAERAAAKKQSRPQRKAAVERSAASPSAALVTAAAMSVPSMKAMSLACDATNAIHVPPPIPMGPYTVVKGRTLIQIATNTFGQRSAMLFSPHTAAVTGQRDLCLTPVIGTFGVGINVPTVNDTFYADSAVTPYAASLPLNNANAQLHSLTVTVTCLSNGNTAEGQVFVGSINQRINRGRFGYWNDVADALIARSEMKPLSAQHISANPLKVSSYPVDISDWCSQVPLVTSSAVPAEMVSMDSLSQIALVFMPTVAAVSYSITVQTEWRINFVDAVLSSTAIARAASKMDFWSMVAHYGQETVGFLERAEQGIERAVKTYASVTTAFEKLLVSKL